MLTGSFLLSFEAVLRKLVGLVSTLILARLLVPEDFGLIAIAFLVMGFIDAVKQFGGEAYLLKAETINKDMINTSWTIRVTTNGFMATLLIIATPYISGYYEDPRLINLLYAFAGIWIMRSFGNPGLIMLRRDQNYLPIIKLSVITKLLAVIMVIVSALLLENYWALVIGQFFTYFSMTIGGYFLYHHRPKLCLTGLKKQWEFSGWWLLQSIVGFCKSQLDTFLVSSIYSQGVLGAYHTIKYFSSMPTTFLMEPLTNPLLVQLRQLKGDTLYFNQQLNVALIVALIIATPISIFFALEHKLIVAVLLGDNWSEYSELFAVFSFTIIIYVFQKQTSEVLVIFGYSKSIFYFQLISMLLIYGALLSIDAPNFLNFAKTKVWMEAIVVFGLTAYVMIKYSSVASVGNLCISIIPIAISITISFFLTRQIDIDHLVFIRLALKGITFFGIYFSCIFLFVFVLKTVMPEWRYIWQLNEKVKILLLAKFRKLIFRLN
jgi:O-antigen/teichoic acid export membrane protein